MSRAGRDTSGTHPDKVLNVILCRGPAPTFLIMAKSGLSQGKSGLCGDCLGKSGLNRGKSGSNVLSDLTTT